MSENIGIKSWQTFYDPLVKIAEETTAELGEATAGLFVELYNDCIDIHGAISSSYSEDELLSSMTFLRFQGLFKEVYWLHLLFLGSDYLIVQARLRFVWEWMNQAYLADSAASLPGRQRRKSP